MEQYVWGPITNERTLSLSFLFIINVLKDFCNGGSLAVPDANAVIEPINRKI